MQDGARSGMVGSPVASSSVAEVPMVDVLATPSRQGVCNGPVPTMNESSPLGSAAMTIPPLHRTQDGVTSTSNAVGSPHPRERGISALAGPRAERIILRVVECLGRQLPPLPGPINREQSFPPPTRSPPMPMPNLRRDQSFPPLDSSVHLDPIIRRAPDWPVDPTVPEMPVRAEASARPDRRGEFEELYRMIPGIQRLSPAASPPVSSASSSTNASITAARKQPPPASSAPLRAADARLSVQPPASRGSTPRDGKRPSVGRSEGRRAIDCCGVRRTLPRTDEGNDRRVRHRRSSALKPTISTSSPANAAAPGGIGMLGSAPQQAVGVSSAAGSQSSETRSPSGFFGGEDTNDGSNDLFFFSSSNHAARPL